MSRLRRAALIVGTVLPIVYVALPAMPPVPVTPKASTTRAATGDLRTISAILKVTPPNTTLPVETDSSSTNTPDWVCIRNLESRDNYRSGGLEPYGGAYQFSVATWQGIGFPGLPNEASPAVQDQAALRLYAISGFSAWETATGCGV